MEIQSFLPETVLRRVNLDTLDVDDFLSYLAKARYLEDVQQMIFTNAILEAYAKEE